jgi:NAD(P)-dependent dehydrogenase (short-subunit alcohol dehydrogenase family)
MRRLENRVALIAGGATGIGAACAERLVAEGCAVVIGDINIGAARDLCATLGERSHAIAYDAANEDSIRALVDGAAAHFGRLDILHNNVALTSLEVNVQDTTVVDIPLSIWRQVFEVNVTSFLLASRFAIPHMIAAGGGSIINTSSGSGRLGDLVRTAYGVSKAAVISLTQHIATQYGADNIRCNAITPGVIMTKNMEIVAADLSQIIKPHVLTTRLGVPGDIAAMVAFLASDDSVYVTGQAIACDGGMHAHQPQIVDVMRFEARLAEEARQ